MLFLLFLRTFSQQISMTDSYYNSWIIYNNSSYNQSFLWQTYQCCTPPKLNIIYANNSTDYQNNLTLNTQGYNLLRLSTSNYGKSYQVYRLNNNGEFQIINKCKYDQHLIDDELNLSGMVKFVLTVQNSSTLENQTLIFHYWFICLYYPSDTYENKQKIDFDLSMVFIIIMACLFVGIFTKLYKIHSIKIQLPNPNNRPSLQRWIAAQPFASEEKYIYFQGFSVTWITYILYLIATLLFYLIVKFNKTWYETILIIVMVFSFFCCYFFLNEMQFFFSVNLRLQNQVLKFIRVCDIISIILSGAIVTIYLVFDQPWYVSCLIAFCISGSLARLFKVVSLRGVTILYILIFIYDLVYYFGLLYIEKVNYQVEVLEYTNYPVLFELPQFHYNLNKICVWLSVTDVIVPGLSIAYLYRFGKNRNTKVYFYMGLSGLFFGIICWALAAFSAASHSVQISQSFIVLPIIVCSASLWGARQGDLRILWYGHFYDYYLTENFTMKSTNEEIEKEFEITEKKAKDLLENLKQDFL